MEMLQNLNEDLLNYVPASGHIPTPFPLPAKHTCSCPKKEIKELTLELYLFANKHASNSYQPMKINLSLGK